MKFRNNKRQGKSPLFKLFRRHAHNNSGDLTKKQLFSLEALEDRTTPTSNLFLDFGDHFPAGGLDMTVLQLRDSLGGGGIQGPDFKAAFAFSDSANISFQSISGQFVSGKSTSLYDYDQNSVVNSSDYSALQSNILALVQRYYAPFDANVSIAPTLDSTSDSTYLSGIQTQLNAGSASNGERDAWVFVAIVGYSGGSGSLGNDSGLAGIAGGADIGGINASDDSAIVFADRILGAPVLELDTRFAYTAAHEAGHTFGLQHSNNGDDTSGNSTTDSDMALMTSSNLVTGTASDDNRKNFDFFTRYPIVRGDNNDQYDTLHGFSASDRVNPGDTLLNTNNLGPKSGAPAYVTGTGGNDQITITKINSTTASVSVRPFRESTYSNPLLGDSAYTYNVNYTNGILVEGGAGADQISIDANIGATITVRGMSAASQVIINGYSTATGGSYTPVTSTTTGLDGQIYRTGSISAGTATISMQEMTSSSSVFVTNLLGTFSYLFSSSTDNLTAAQSSGVNQITGTSGGFTLLPLYFSNIGALNVSTDGGDDVLTIDYTGGNPIPSGGLTFAADGGSFDELIIRQANALTLLNTSVSDGSRTITLSGVDGVQLYDNRNVSNNYYAASVSAYQIIMDGGSGDDSLVGGSLVDSLIGGDGNDTIYSTSGADTLVGGNGNDIINVGVTDPATIDGGSGTDVIVVTRNVDSLTISSSSISGKSVSINYTGFEGVNLTGGSLNNSFTASGNAIIVVLSGLGGDDTLVGGTLSDNIYGGDGNDVIIGGSGSDYLQGDNNDDSILAGDGNDTIIGSSGVDTIDGGIGTGDVFGLTFDTTKTLTIGDTSISDGTATWSYSNIEGALVTGGGLANRMDASGASINVVLLGDGGNDTLIGGSGNDNLGGGGGDDSLIANGGSDYVIGDDGNDTILAGSGNDSVDGAAGNDLIYTDGGGNDVAYGGAGADTLQNIGSSATLFGGADNDLIYGDTVLGDTLYGDDGSDTIFGYGGNDLITTGNGADCVDGGSGVDTVTDATASDTLFNVP